MAGSRLWVGNAAGQIYVTEGQKLQQVAWDVLEQGPGIRSMHPDDRGLWLSTDAGIYRVLLR